MIAATIAALAFFIAIFLLANADAHSYKSKITEATEVVHEPPYVPVSTLPPAHFLHAVPPRQSRYKQITGRIVSIQGLLTDRAALLIKQ